MFFVVNVCGKTYHIRILWGPKPESFGHFGDTSRVPKLPSTGWPTRRWKMVWITRTHQPQMRRVANSTTKIWKTSENLEIYMGCWKPKLMLEEKNISLFHLQEPIQKRVFLRHFQHQLVGGGNWCAISGFLLRSDSSTGEKKRETCPGVRVAKRGNLVVVRLFANLSHWVAWVWWVLDQTCSASPTQTSSAMLHRWRLNPLENLWTLMWKRVIFQWGTKNMLKSPGIRSWMSRSAAQRLEKVFNFRVRFFQKKSTSNPTSLACWMFPVHLQWESSLQVLAISWDATPLPLYLCPPRLHA